MYTLRLLVMENSGNVLTYEMPVVVDNTPPTVQIIHPAPDEIYVMETDELVCITAEAQDDWEMDRVEFYMDGNKLGDATVAPYSVRWTIKMTDVVPKSGPTVYATRVITNPDGTVTTEQVIERETKTEKYKKADGTTGAARDRDDGRRRRRDRHGRQAARDSHVLGQCVRQGRQHDQELACPHLREAQGQGDQAVSAAPPCPTSL